MAKLAREGYAILTPMPSCTLMFKQELPLMFPDDADVQAVKEAMFDPFEYFVLRAKDGLLKKDFKAQLGKVSYHIPCHSRVQNVGQKTREMLQMIPGTAVTTVERCAGHDGTWGVKKEYFDNSMKIGRPVFRQLAAAEPDYISSDCPIAARHIMQGMGEEEEARREGAPAHAAAQGLRNLSSSPRSPSPCWATCPTRSRGANLLDGMIDAHERGAARVRGARRRHHLGQRPLRRRLAGSAPEAVRALPASVRAAARRQRMAGMQTAAASIRWNACSKWRQLFCCPIPLESFARQSGKYCENVRWEHDGCVFVGPQHSRQQQQR